MMFTFPRVFLQHKTPSYQNAPSATFHIPVRLWGQRPRQAHGPSAAFQGGQPPALASCQASCQVPGKYSREPTT